MSKEFFCVLLRNCICCLFTIEDCYFVVRNFWRNSVICRECGKVVHPVMEEDARPSGTIVKEGILQR